MRKIIICVVAVLSLIFLAACGAPKENVKNSDVVTIVPENDPKVSKEIRFTYTTILIPNTVTVGKVTTTTFTPVIIPVPYTGNTSDKSMSYSYNEKIYTLDLANSNDLEVSKSVTGKFYFTLFKKDIGKKNAPVRLYLPDKQFKKYQEES